MIGGSSLGIGVTLFLRDQFTGPAQRIKASSKDLNAQMRRMQEDQLRHQRNLNMGLAFGGAMALRGIGKQIKKAADYNYEMEFVKSITTATADEQKRLLSIASRLAGETMFYPKDIAEGMRFMSMAGMEATQVMQNIEGAVNLAGATMSQLGGKGGAADIMTNVMKQFAIDFKYTTDVADILSYAVTRSNTNLFDLGEALKYAGSTSMDLNIGLEESTAMVMALGNAGMQGSMAGVAMENSMRYLSRAFSDFGSGPSKKALGMLGLQFSDVTDSAGDLLSMTEIITKIGGALANLPGGNVQQQALLQSIFGVRGKRAGSLFIRNLQEFKKFTGEIATKATGHSANIMSDMMSTLRGEIDKTKSQWEAFWIAFSTSVEPIVKFLVKGMRVLAKTLTWLMDIPFFSEFLSTGLTAFIAINTVAFAFKGIMAGLKLMQSQFTSGLATMGVTGTAAWNSMTIAAGKYAGVAGMANLTAMAGKGKLKGLTTNTAGRIISRQTGRFVSGGAAAAVAAGGARVVAGQVVARKAAGLALTRLAGVFGGPLGMALTFVLPGLIGMAVRAIKGNREATEKNTETIQSTADKEAANRNTAVMEHAIRFMGITAPQNLAIGTTDSRTASNTQGASMLAGELHKIMQIEREQPLAINVILDGETIFTDHIQNILKKNNDYTERNIGVY